jgi:hypothetical protein
MYEKKFTDFVSLRDYLFRDYLFRDVRKSGSERIDGTTENSNNRNTSVKITELRFTSTNSRIQDTKER